MAYANNIASIYDTYNICCEGKKTEFWFVTGWKQLREPAFLVLALLLLLWCVLCVEVTPSHNNTALDTSHIKMLGVR